MKPLLRLIVDNNLHSAEADAPVVATRRISVDAEPLRRLLSQQNGAVPEHEFTEGKLYLFVLDLARERGDAVETAVPHESRDIAPPTAVSPASPPTDGPLSERELQVLRYVGEGLSDKEISVVLKIEPCTVKSHIVHIIRKLKLQRTNRTAAVVTAAKLGLLKLY